MAEYSVCGLDCEQCKYRIEKSCLGCRRQEGQIFWGECALFSCCREKKAEHCGGCGQFPCQTLREWASEEGPERIDNLRRLMDSTQ